MVVAIFRLRFVSNTRTPACRQAGVRDYQKPFCTASLPIVITIQRNSTQALDILHSVDYIGIVV
jgi:hypothetical protein